MTLRGWAELALVILAATAGWGYVHQRDERLRAEGRLELVQAVADSTAKAAADAKAATVAADSARAASDRREEARRAQDRDRADRAAAKVPAAADSVVAAAAPADSAAVRARVQQLEGIHEDREGALLDIIRSDSVTIAQLRALDVTRLTAIESLESALASSQAKADAALEARPGWVERNLPKVGIGAAVVVGWILHGAVAG